MTSTAITTASKKGKKVTLKKEQYIQLEWCRLKAS